VQFHAIHLYRVKAANGITGVEDGSLSCSSCHKTFGGKFDRETPRQTCANCHNGYAGKPAGQPVVEADKPNCTSCHVQHYYDDYRWGDLLTESAAEERKLVIDKNYIDAVRRSALPK
jgi:formate-dependent nitrite reductase cytochrome c552 subunit